MKFTEMPLIAPILKATREAGYDEPTPIQRETIPFVLEGNDVLGCAQTGTGKTAAFALPILQRLFTEKQEGSRKPRALVLTPTRELAIQIQENFALYGKHLPLKSCVIFGGVNQSGQVDQLRRGVQVIIATPGRLNDLIGQGHIKLDAIEIFVLDEADRMLDMGFIYDVKRVIAQLPAKRQTLFFSATMPGEVEKLAMSILSSPKSVKVDPVSSTVDTIRQTLFMVDKLNKKFLLADLLKKPNVENALVFTRTKHGADRVVRELERMGVRSMAIHGDKSQSARQAALGQFKNGDLKVLIATDIAARGIDVVGLSHVINYDLPNEPEAYVHRIGRTGRAGLEGDAISFCCIDEMKCLAGIEKLIGKRIPREESAWPMQVFTETVKEARPPRPERVTRVNMRGEAIAERSPASMGRPGMRRGNDTRSSASAWQNRSAAVPQAAGWNSAPQRSAAQPVRTQAASAAAPQRVQPALPRQESVHARPERREVRPDQRNSYSSGERSQRVSQPRARKYESR